MNTSTRRKLPPLWIFLIVFVTLYAVVSVGLTMIFKMPWQAPMPPMPAIIAGTPLVALGILIIVWAFKAISFRRATGGELFLDKSESKLITYGPYAYTRNPLYVGSFIGILGWFILLRLTPLGFLTLIFAVHFYVVAKWEERELKERFGQEYIEYAKSVPLFFPRLIGGKQ